MSLCSVPHTGLLQKKLKKKNAYWSSTCARRLTMLHGWWPQKIENDKWPPTPFSVIRFHERWAPNQIMRPQRPVICMRTRAFFLCRPKQISLFIMLFEITCYFLMFGMFWVLWYMPVGQGKFRQCALDVGSAEWTGTAAEDVPFVCQYEILLIIYYVKGGNVFFRFAASSLAWIKWHAGFVSEL